MAGRAGLRSLAESPKSWCPAEEPFCDDPRHVQKDQKDLTPSAKAATDSRMPARRTRSPRAAAPPTVPVPRKLERWFQDPIMVSRLRELLSEEAFQVAQATLLDAALPTYAHLNRPNEENVLRHAWLAGYRDALRDLLALTVAPAARNRDLPEEWAHIED